MMHPRNRKSSRLNEEGSDTRKSSESAYSFADDNDHEKTNHYEYDADYYAIEDAEEEEFYEEFDPVSRQRSLTQSATMTSSQNFVKNFRAKLVDKGARLKTHLKEKQFLNTQLKVRSPFHFSRKKDFSDTASTKSAFAHSAPQSPKAASASIAKQPRKSVWYTQEAKAEAVEHDDKNQCQVNNDLYSMDFSQSPVSPENVSSQFFIERESVNEIYQSVNNEADQYHPFSVSSETHLSNNSHKKKNFKNQPDLDVLIQNRIKFAQELKAKTAVSSLQKVSTKPQVDYSSKPSFSSLPPKDSENRKNSEKSRQDIQSFKKDTAQLNSKEMQFTVQNENVYDVLKFSRN